ncbi:efflux RND transporter periplasmic adaptor subunit [Tropicimonas sp. IMCC6043]|uniref:efflux RND transporter periplasmic adaptor subunit n=1 Tax=Tropicimonas sp. IMCC6043 TaxID=2510645 RepID=UPI00101C8C8A|nr:efflux RND transporter periplasmic adaptor subunit [Tropicimonas sp. IMCC6043]RYH07328.1 efflux RND transporter periplasmic adaptor subunit [Tropicimonas sp. IMCC6043]
MTAPFALSLRTIMVLALLAPCTARAQSVIDCLMDPSESVDLGSPVTGLLEEVLVQRGDEVEAGQLVARLNSSVEESTVELLELRANSTSVIDAQREQLAMIERRHDRISALRERGVATEEALDLVEAERISAQSLLVQAELNRDIAIKELVRARAALGLREIHAPISGIVSERALTGGEFVGQDDYVLRIVRLDPLSVEGFVPVEMFGRVKVGDRALITPAPPLSGSFDAVVTVVDRVFDAASGTFVVRLELPNPEGRLPAGHRCELAFVDES